MLRLFFVLLILVGLTAVGFGSVQMLSSAPDRRAASDRAESQSADMTMPAPQSSAESTPLPDFVPSMQGSEDEMSVRTASGGFIDTLKSVPIAHESPTRARFGRAFEVTLAVDGTGGDSAADALPGVGRVVESIAMISADVEATLSGDAFEITPVTPMVQSISPLTENVWRWNAVPLESGTQSLTIEVFALNGDRRLPIRTFRDRVDVQVSAVGQAIALADALSPIAVVIGGIGSLIAGLLGIFRFLRER